MLHVKISTTLRKYVKNYNPETGLEIGLEPGKEISVLTLAEQLEIPVSEIKFIMLNGRYQPLTTILHPDDRVAFFPAVGGG